MEDQFGHIYKAPNLDDMYKEKEFDHELDNVNRVLVYCSYLQLIFKGLSKKAKQAKRSRLPNPQTRKTAPERVGKR